MTNVASSETTNDNLNTEFQQSVRSALLHLYDNAFLQSHSLTAMWATDGQGDRLTHAQDLRRVLLDCIERLRPQRAMNGDAARAYAVLTYRCIDSLTIEEIEQKLGLSRRQTYREFAKGVEAVATQLQDLLCARATHRLTEQPASQLDQANSPHPTRRALAEAELERLCRDVRCEALSLGEVLQGVCHLLDSRLSRRCINVHRSDLDTTPPVLADRTLLRQALLNLLSYALDMLPEGSHLHFRAEEQTGALRIALRQVSAGAVEADTAVQKKLREGVAITVAQSLLLAQNGRLTLHESPGEWSAEIVLLTAHTPTLLIIDDNQNLIELFQRYLAGHRIVVYGANSGDGALSLLRQITPQAIMLDVMMPHQDGWEVLQRLQKEPAAASIPIIVCSVLREHDLALALGASDTLVKPVNQPALLDVLRRWIGTLHPIE